MKKIEIFSSLSAVESKIDETTFADGTNELQKRAILVDDFKGHGVSDVSNDDYRCSIDFQSKELRPSFKIHDDSFVVENVDENLNLHTNGIITLDYDDAGSTLAEQPKASETISVNPYQLTNWVGIIETNDAIDPWFDDQTRPLVRTNTIGENDAWVATSFEDALVGFGSQWNEIGCATFLTFRKRLAEVFAVGRDARISLVLGRIPGIIGCNDTDGFADNLIAAKQFGRIG